MIITIDLSQKDIDILHNAVSIFCDSCFAGYIGCDSKYGEAMKKKYPDMHPFDRSDMIMEHAKRAKEIITMIENMEE